MALTYTWLCLSGFCILKCEPRNELATFLLAAFNLLSQSKAFIRKSVHLVKVFIKQHVSVRLCPSHRHERAYFGVKQSATELFSTLFGEFVIQKQQWTDRQRR